MPFKAKTPADIRAEEEQARQQRLLDDAVTRVREARLECERSAVQLMTASEDLRTLSRRLTPVTGLPNFTSSHIRLAGTVLHSVRRSGNTDRLLAMMAEETRAHSERETRAQAAKARAQKSEERKLASVKQTVGDDFDTVYGDIV